MPADIIGAPAKINITGQLQRLQGDAVEQFTLTNTLTIPATVQFFVINTDGSTLSPVAAQSGQTVVVSAAAANVGSVGVFYIWRQLPTSVGFYTYEWRMWGSGGASSGTIAASVFTVQRGEFEIFRTAPQSFFSYGNKSTVLQVARKLIGRDNLTEVDIQPYMEGADGYINSRLGIVMTVPFSPTPFVVRDMSQVFALAAMYGDYYGGQQQAETPPAIIQRRDWYKILLDNVVEGRAAIEVTSGTVSRMDTTISQLTGGIEGGTMTFGMRDPIEQTQDSDIITAEKDAAK